MSVVKGKNVILYFQYNGEFKPLACFQTCTLTTVADIGETSSKNTGKWKTFRGTKMSWTVSCSGLCSEDSNLTIPQLRTIQFNLQAIFISFTATDDNGIIENFSGNCIVTNIDTTGDVSAWYTFSMDAQGIGELVSSDEVTNPNECCDTLWAYYDGVGGEFETPAIPELIGNKIDGRIYRDGIEYRPSGALQDGLDTPVGKQFKFDSVLGKLYFDTDLPPLAPGEAIDIPYLTCEEVGSDCVNVTIAPRFLPDGVIGQNYNETIGLTGTAPFTLVPGATKPDWMNISISGSNVVLVGIPTEAATGLEISFTVTNCSGSSDSFSDTINVTDCIAVEIVGTPSLPDVQEDTDYLYSFDITGSSPITLFILDKPSWMSIDILSNSVQFTGHAGVHTSGVHVQIQLVNCTDASVMFEDTFDITI